MTRNLRIYLLSSVLMACNQLYSQALLDRVNRSLSPTETRFHANNADFALTIKGDSMIGDNIHPGDIVFIRQQPTVEIGEIAAVLIDGDATLKHFYRDGDSVTLVSSNPKYKPMVYHKGDCDDIRILGKAVAYLHDLE